MEKNKRLEKEKLVDFRKIGAIIQKNFIVMTRDKARILPLIMFPVFMILIFGFTSGNSPKHISAALVAYDNSHISTQIQQAISNSEALSIKHIVSTEGEGMKLLDKGKVKVLIVIPQNLNDNIDNGYSSAITVIVDESDSSIASAARQTISIIAKEVSKEISKDKVLNFQNSIGEASQKMQNYNNKFVNRYSIIISKSKDAQSSLDDASKNIKTLSVSISNSLLSPIPLVASSAYPSKNSSFNETFLSESLGYTTAKAQIASLEKSNALIQMAQQNLKQAQDASNEGSKSMQSIQDLQSKDENIIEPAAAIKKFTSYDSKNLIEPLSYEEKPAYGTGKRTIDFLIPSIIALVIFQGAVMGMGRAVAGEKRAGSLTRVFLTPTSNITIILGTLLFYIVFEIFRSSFLIILAINLFHIKIEGSLISVFFIMVIYAGVSTAIGMLLSSFVKSEEQYMAMSMLVSMPTIFLGGAFFPVQSMPKFLQGVASFLPVTYAGDALRGIMIKGFSLATVSYDIMILLVFLALTVGAVFLVFRRDIE